MAVGREGTAPKTGDLLIFKLPNVLVTAVFKSHQSDSCILSASVFPLLATWLFSIGQKG